MATPSQIASAQRALDRAVAKSKAADAAAKTARTVVAAAQAALGALLWPVKPAPAPAPPPTPQPAPVTPPGAPAATITPPGRIDMENLGPPSLDWVASRDGLHLARNGGPWLTRRPYAAQNDDPAGDGWKNREGGNSENMAWYADAELGMNPFVVQPDGLHISVREFTPSQRARCWPAQPSIQGMAFWSGQIIPNLRINPQSAYISVKAKTSGVMGQWPAVCLYGAHGDQFAWELDILECMGPSGASACSFHKWTPPQVHDSALPTMAVPNSNLVAVEFGLLLTPGRARWYRNEVLARDLQIDVIPDADPLYLQICNQAVKAQAWGAVGPMAMADLPRADLIVEAVRIYPLI